MSRDILRQAEIVVLDLVAIAQEFRGESPDECRFADALRTAEKDRLRNPVAGESSATSVSTAAALP